MEISALNEIFTRFFTAGVVCCVELVLYHLLLVVISKRRWDVPVNTLNLHVVCASG